MGGEDDIGPAFFGAVDGIQDFLLVKSVMIGEAFGVDEFGALLRQTLLEALGLGNTAQRGDFFSFEPADLFALFGIEDVLEKERPMDALDDTGGGVVFADTSS